MSKQAFLSLLTEQVLKKYQHTAKVNPPAEATTFVQRKGELATQTGVGKDISHLQKFDELYYLHDA